MLDLTTRQSGLQTGFHDEMQGRVEDKQKLGPMSYTGRAPNIDSSYKPIVEIFFYELEILHNTQAGAPVALVEAPDAVPQQYSRTKFELDR